MRKSSPGQSSRQERRGIEAQLRSAQRKEMRLIRERRARTLEKLRALPAFPTSLLTAASLEPPAKHDVAGDDSDAEQAAATDE